MLSKKSFLADERNFLAPLVRATRGDVRDHIDSHKSDRRSSYLSYRGLQRRKQRKTDLREIFGAAQFSTFSTVSARSRHGCEFFGAAKPLPWDAEMRYHYCAAINCWGNHDQAIPGRSRHV